MTGTTRNLNSKQRRRWKVEILAYQNGRCKYCEIELTYEDARLDHSVPASIGGTHRYHNFVVACDPCNYKKSSKIGLEWGNAMQVECGICHIEYTVPVNDADLKLWKDGKKLIQNAMPYLTASQRELLMTGTCGFCWERMFPPEEK